MALNVKKTSLAEAQAHLPERVDAASSSPAKRFRTAPTRLLAALVGARLSIQPASRFESGEVGAMRRHAS